MILRARALLPVAEPPIDDGAVVLAGNRVADVGRWCDLSSLAPGREVVDLGNVVLMPGLINAHCHLDYTDMAGRVPPQKSFVNWIKLLTSAKSEWSYSEYAQSWLRGARMLLQSGTTTVADMEAVPELLPEVWMATPLRVVSFLEMTGVRSRRLPHLIVQEAVERIHSLPNGRSRASLAPHAPYSTVPELLRLSAVTTREHHWPLSTHVSESDQEYEMFVHARGELFAWLRRNERDLSDCGLGSPVEHLERSGGLAERLIAIHANYLSKKDISLLRKRRATVVHCPRSHAYFQHHKFAFSELSRARVNICLGTDSLATVYKRLKQSVELNMFEEMRAFSKANPRVPARTIVRMATINGANALDLGDQAGQLSPGAFADLIAIPFTGKLKGVYQAVVRHQGAVSASMIDGHWAIAPDSHTRARP
jgi:aminodeoxyfutalosine deaminase